MQQSRVLTVFITGAILLFILWMSVFVVNPRQQVAIKRLGEVIGDVKTEPGLYFKLPFLDQVVIVDNRLRYHALPTETVQVQNGAFYEVDAFFTYRITNARLFLQRVPSADPSFAARNNLESGFVLALRSVYGKRDLRAALSSERAEMMRDVQRQFSGYAESLGMRIIDVRIRKTDLPQEASQRTFERMRQERVVQAEGERARGNQERERIRAEADRQHEQIVAAATRDGEILRGEAEAEKIRILDEAIATDPEFYAFRRSMDAYQEIRHMPMVVSPDSPFFQYMRNPQIGDILPENNILPVD